MPIYFLLTSLQQSLLCNSRYQPSRLSKCDCCRQRWKGLKSWTEVICFTRNPYSDSSRPEFIFKINQSVCMSFDKTSYMPDSRYRDRIWVSTLIWLTRRNKYNTKLGFYAQSGDWTHTLKYGCVAVYHWVIKQYVIYPAVAERFTGYLNMLYTYHFVFITTCQHNNVVDALRPNHSPHVTNGAVHCTCISKLVYSTAMLTND